MKKYLTSNEICEIFGICKMTLNRWEKRYPHGEPFPRPVMGGGLGGGDKRYLSQEVHAWELKHTAK